jgi:hypothetical protein
MALKQEQASIVKTLLDSYGVGVRAGVLTPCLEDENWFRKLIGLDPASAKVVADWASTNGIRKPNTLKEEVTPTKETEQP